MRKRILASILTVCMLLTLIPYSAVATELEREIQYDDYVSIHEFAAESTGDITISNKNDDEPILTIETVDETDYIHAVGVGEATVAVGEETFKVTVKPAQLNVVLVSGQSNANGVHGSKNVQPIAPDLGNGYWWSGSELEDLGTHIDGIRGSEGQEVSIGWYPALAAEWYALTGEKTVIIHQCVSGSPISGWASYEKGDVTQRTTQTADTVEACISAIQENENYEIVRTGYYWLQGETDAFINAYSADPENNQGTQKENPLYPTAAQYERAYLGMHEAYVGALQVNGLDAPYGAILSCRTRTNGNYKNIEYCGMRVAQQNLANQYEDIYMASVIMEDWTAYSVSCNYTAESGEYRENHTAGQMINGIHYNQSGYNVMGLDAADNMYQALCETSEITDIELIGHDGITRYDEEEKIYVDDNLRITDTLNEAVDTGKAQIVARPMPISAACDQVTMTLTDESGEAVEGVMDERGWITVEELEKPLMLTVTAGDVKRTYTLTSKELDDGPAPIGQSFHYKWDFTDNSSYSSANGKMTVSSVFDENTLTYTAGSAAHSKENGLTNTSGNWFDMANGITLDKNASWTIEWKGTLNSGSNGVLLSDNTGDYSNGGRTTPYIYLRNNGDQSTTNSQKDPSTGISDVRYTYSGTVGGPSVSFPLAKGEEKFTDEQTWKLTNDGVGSLTLSNESGDAKITAFGASDPDSVTFNGVLGRFGTGLTLCYTGTIAYLDIYTPDRAGESAATGIEVTTQPAKRIYQPGETFDAAGMVVTLSYSNGEEEEIEDYTVTPETMTAGTKAVTISYTTKNGKVLTTTQAVAVAADSSQDSGAKNYHWDFTQASGGTTLEAVVDEKGIFAENTLTYVKASDDKTATTIPTAGENGMPNTSEYYFKPYSSITLKKDTAWTIEWQGGDMDGQSVLLSNNDDEGTGSSQFDFKGEYIYLFNDSNTLGNRIALRDKATHTLAVMDNIPDEIYDNSKTVWRMSHDGNGTLTISYKLGETEASSTAKVDGVNRDYTFNGVLGRFAKNGMQFCYTGNISYLKVWEEVRPIELQVELMDSNKTLEMGQTLTKEDLSVQVLYNDGSIKDADYYEIGTVQYDADGRLTVSVTGVADGQIVKGSVLPQVDTDGYRWNFNDSNMVDGEKTLKAVQGNNNLTYSGTLTVDEDGLTNDGKGYFTMDKEVTLSQNAPWTIEWKGSTDAQSVLLANNDDKTDVGTPKKAGEYIYIFNDTGAEFGNGVSLRTNDTHAAVTFTGISQAARKDEDAVWYLIHDGQGNLKLARTGSDGLTYVTEKKDVIDRDYTFNGVLGYFAQNTHFNYSGTIQYLAITPTAKDIDNSEGTLKVDTDKIETNGYLVGESLDLTGLGVSFTLNGETDSKPVSEYTVSLSPAVLQPGENQVTISVTALGRTQTETVSVSVEKDHTPAYYHWSGGLDELKQAEDSEENALEQNGKYYDMSRPVYLDPAKHWQIQWTGALEEGRNGVLLSANTPINSTNSTRTTPYLYIRNGGDNGQYDVILCFSGTQAAAGNIHFTMTEEDDIKTLGNPNTTWTLDYEDGTLTLSNDGTYQKSMPITDMGPVVFNGIGGYFNATNSLFYTGTLSDLKIYEDFKPAEPKYYWDFTDVDKVTGNNQLEAVTDDGYQSNTLIYSQSTLVVGEDGLANDGKGYFTMDKEVTLSQNEPWTIEWKGSTNAQSVLLAKNNAETDTASPNKAGEYIYIFNDTGDELGNSISLRKQNTTSAATFSGIPNADRGNADTVWYLIHDGESNLTLAKTTSDGFTEVMEKVSGAVQKNYTFNGVLGYFTTGAPFNYRGTIQYLKIYPEAAEVTTTEGTLTASADKINAGPYYVGETLDLSDLVVKFNDQEITSYVAATNPGVLTGGTTSVEVTVSAFGKKATCNVSVTVNETKPAYHHWSGSLDQLTEQADATAKNTLTVEQNKYHAMERPVSLEPENHWQIQWTGAVAEGSNGVLLSANTKSNSTNSTRTTPYIYIRNGGDGGMYDISLCYSGTQGANQNIHFTIVESDREALKNDDTTWTLDYQKGTLTLSNDQGYTQSQSVTVQPIVFNGVAGYFASTNTLYYKGALTDLKIYEALYDVAVSSTAGGTVSAETASNVSGTTEKITTYPEAVITLSNTPEDGYGVSSYTVTDANGKEISVAEDGTFAMPLSDVTVSAVFLPLYTVTYTDGVDGAVIFEDQVTSNILSGTATPAFSGTPTREGYTFSGWSPAVAGTVTGNAVYTATWTKAVDNSGSHSGGGGGSSSAATYPVNVESAKNGAVKADRTSAAKGATVTLTVTPKDGYELDGLTVTDKNGKTVKVTEGKNGKYTFTMPASKVTVEASFAKIEEQSGISFRDVPTSAYYYDAVKWAVEKGITTGTSAANFNPDASCTRAQAVTFLWRAAGSPAPKSSVNPFADVSTSTYYYDAVLWAVEQGITAGTSATTFSPDATCTRAQIVTFLWRAAGTTASGNNPFTDVAADAYYADAVKWAVAKGITAGTSATTFSPNAACTRAQIVTFLYRAET